jgi:hypothetical protein
MNRRSFLSGLLAAPAAVVVLPRVLGASADAAAVASSRVSLDVDPEGRYTGMNTHGKIITVHGPEPGMEYLVSGGVHFDRPMEEITMAGDGFSTFMPGLRRR